jgi:hypothetical protein
LLDGFQMTCGGRYLGFIGRIMSAHFRPQAQSRPVFVQQFRVSPLHGVHTQLDAFQPFRLHGRLSDPFPAAAGGCKLILGIEIVSKLFRFLFPAVKLAAGAAAALATLGLAVTSAAGQTTPADATYSKSVQPFFVRNCYASHNSGLSSGGLNLQAFSSAALFFQDRDEAEKVLKKLQAGEMPPKALPGPDADKYGAFHTSEVPYVFNSLTKSDRPFTDADHKIAEIMSSYWANFATTGDPTARACLTGLRSARSPAGPWN